MQLSSHHKRLITALVLLPLLIGAVLARGPWLFAGVLAASLAGLLEFYTMFWPGRMAPGKKTIGSVLCVLVLLAAWRSSLPELAASLVLSYWIGNLFFLTAYSRTPATASYTNAAVLVSGLLYVPFALQFFLVFHPVETFFVMLATFATDTGGYYAGSLIGGPKIWPAISPKKTWAGSAGGMALCCLVCVIYGLTWGQGSFWSFLAAGIVLNLAGQFGDFFESALKRWIGIKDSGNLLPGHGGMLDRIDGLLLAAPAYAGLRAVFDLFIP